VRHRQAGAGSSYASSGICFYSFGSVFIAIDASSRIAAVPAQTRDSRINGTTARREIPPTMANIAAMMISVNESFFIVYYLHILIITNHRFLL
jgi:hypothetical protein